MAIAFVACSGILGQILPPSVPILFYAIITVNSILGVWFSTLGPPIVIVGMYIFLNKDFPILKQWIRTP